LTKSKPKKSTPKKSTKKSVSKSKPTESSIQNNQRVTKKSKPGSFSNRGKNFFKFYAGLTIFTFVISIIFGDATCSPTVESPGGVPATNIVPPREDFGEPKSPDIPSGTTEEEFYSEEFDDYAEEQNRELEDEQYFVENNDY
jgi:hypothetical protein